MSVMRIWKQDPSVSGIGIRKTYIHTKVFHGPKDALIEIEGMPTVRYDKRGDFLVEPMQETRFDAVHTFAVVRQVVTIFERALRRAGLRRDFRWQWGKGRIRVHPHAGDAKNAFYSREDRSLKFYHFDHRSLGRVYTCRSFDLVAHETGHAILDSLCPGYWESWHPETDALHESFADITVLLSMVAQLDQCEAIIAESRGDLAAESFFNAVGEQVGEALYGHRAGLRNAREHLTIAEARARPHDLSQVFTGAVYEILEKLFADFRKPGEFDLAESLCKIGKRLTGLLLRAFVSGPKTNAGFRDIAEAMIALEPRPAWRAIIRRAFDARGILADRPPLTARSLEHRPPRQRFTLGARDSARLAASRRRYALAPTLARLEALERRARSLIEPLRAEADRAPPRAILEAREPARALQLLMSYAADHAYHAVEADESALDIAELAARREHTPAAIYEALLGFLRVRALGERLEGDLPELGLLAEDGGASGVEATLDPWRQHPGLAAFYAAWHRARPAPGPLRSWSAIREDPQLDDDDRAAALTAARDHDLLSLPPRILRRVLRAPPGQGQAASALRRQLLARYDAERRDLGLLPTRPLDPGKLIEEGCDLGVLGRRSPCQRLPADEQRAIAALERALDGCPAEVIGARLEGLIEEGLADEEARSIDGLARRGPGDLDGLVPGALQEPRWGPRDPAFWRWQKRLDDRVFDAEEELEPLDLAREAPPLRLRSGAEPWASPDLMIAPLAALGLRPGEARAFAEARFGGRRWGAPLRSGEASSPQIRGRAEDRCHEPFAVFLRIENRGRGAITAAVRIFIAPAEAAEDRRALFELDAFLVRLRPKERRVVAREDHAFSVLDEAAGPMRPGWPRQLLLPRGRAEGAAYRALAIAELVGDAPELTDEVEGLPSPLFRKGEPPGGRPFNFPFHRPVRGGIAAALGGLDHLAGASFVVLGEAEG